jgi:hypothetical protein
MPDQIIDCYLLPKRYTNLTANQMDLWDALYFLAAQTQQRLHQQLAEATTHSARQTALIRLELHPPGTLNTSTAELRQLTGVERRAIGDFLAEVEQPGLIKRVENLGKARGYGLKIVNYQPDKGIRKPMAYVANGWLKAIRDKHNLALPKRLLNYYLGRPANTPGSLRFDSVELGTLLRKKNLNGKFNPQMYPISLSELAEAHYLLRNLGLLEEEFERPGFYRVRLERFIDLPPEFPLDPLHPFYQSSLYQTYHTQDPTRLGWLEDLVRLGNFPLEESQLETIWQQLQYLQHDPWRYEILRKKARRQRDKLHQHAKWQETWRLYLGELERRTVRLETLPPFRFELSEGRVELDWREDLEEFGQQVFQPQLRGRITGPRFWLTHYKSSKFKLNLTISSTARLIYSGQLVWGEQPKTLGEFVCDLFQDYLTNFPLQIRLEGWEGPEIGGKLELWFQGLSRKGAK